MNNPSLGTSGLYDLVHVLAGRWPHWNPSGLEAFEAVDIDAQVFGRDPLSVERIYAANTTELVRRRMSMKAILYQIGCTFEQPKAAFMDLDHQRIFSPAY
jgi:hypothetical protein